MPLAAVAAVAATPPCQPRYPTTHATAAMFDMASSTAEMLDALPDPRVVVLARGGQGLSRYGLKHSHLAFAMRDDDGICRVRHLLDRCKSDASQLYVEGLRNFVGESATSSDLRVGVLTPAVQQRLQALLSDSGELAHRLHETRYSMSVFDFLHQRDALVQELSIPHATAITGATP
nr:DUF2145 domain-containing protein [Xanthomonas prunicola]